MRGQIPGGAGPDSTLTTPPAEAKLHSRFTHVDFSGNRLQVELAGAPVEAMAAGWDLACTLMGTMDPWRLEKIDYAPAGKHGATEAVMALTFNRVPPPMGQQEFVVGHQINVILDASNSGATCDEDNFVHVWRIRPDQFNPGLGARCVCGANEWDSAYDAHRINP